MQLSIVSYLDQVTTSRVRELQKTMSEITGSRASLDSWSPHVTLGDGVDVTDLELNDLIDEIQDAANTTSSFTIDVSGFSSLDSRPIGVGEISTPYAIFIDVVVGRELLDLVAKIDEVTTARSIWYHMPRPYLPHITLAFRDLSETGYKNGLEYLSDKNIQFSSTINHIALVQKLPDTNTEYIRIQLS